MTEAFAQEVGFAHYESFLMTLRVVERSEAL